MLTQLKVGRVTKSSGLVCDSGFMLSSGLFQSALSPYLSVLVRGEVVWGGEVVDRSGPVVPQTSGRQKGATSSVGVDSVDLYLKQVGVELLLRAASLNIAMVTVEVCQTATGCLCG